MSPYFERMIQAVFSDIQENSARMFLGVDFVYNRNIAVVISGTPEFFPNSNRHKMRFFENRWVINIIRLLIRIGVDNLCGGAYSHRQKISGKTKIERIYGVLFRKKISNTKDDSCEQQQDKYTFGIGV